MIDRSSEVMKLSCSLLFEICFFFNDTATTEIYTLSLHDALPISDVVDLIARMRRAGVVSLGLVTQPPAPVRGGDRKSTRLNSSHVEISYAVFCLKKKKKSLSPSLLLQKKH